MEKIVTFNEVLDYINDEIAQLNWQKQPIGLYEPIGYILSLGGKRIRPAITLMSYNLYANSFSEIIKPALGLEVFHNFTLLHDDIMDRADKRRGQPTVHNKWNDNTAILSGDVMQIEAYKLIAETPKSHLKEVLDLFSVTAAEICEGQQLDMEFEQRFEVTSDEYLEMIRLKTAVLLATGAKIGAILGGGKEDDAENLYQFGMAIGIAFQLKDDLLDVYGNEQNFGKKIGGDILCNKKTMLLIETLGRAEGDDLKELHNWILEDNPSENEQKISSVTQIYNKVGAKEICEKSMMDYYHLALENLEKVSVDSNKKAELRKLAEMLLFRKD